MQRATLTDVPGRGLKTATAQQLLDRDEVKNHPQFEGIKAFVVFIFKFIWSAESVTPDKARGHGRFSHVLDNPPAFREMWLTARTGVTLSEMPGEVIIFVLWLVKSYMNKSYTVILNKFCGDLRPRKV